MQTRHVGLISVILPVLAFGCAARQVQAPSVTDISAAIADRTGQGLAPQVSGRDRCPRAYCFKMA